MKLKRVVVTGVGALTPIGNNVNKFWDSLLNGVSGAEQITKFDASLFKTRFACELKGYQSSDFFDRKEARKTDPFTQYALIAADEAVNHAKLDFDSIDTDRCGVIWSSGNGGIYTFDQELKAYAESGGNPRFSPFFIPKILIDTPSGAISIKFGLKGANYCPVSACASSTTAIIDAFNYIRLGKADLIVTGGSEAPITESGVGGFGAMKALSTRNETPATASRPFDAARDGFVMGEGAAALILESLEHAQNRGATIFGEIAGGGMTADAYHPTATHPDGTGALKGMKLALEEANIPATALNYINAHATSTPVGDLSELSAISQLLPDSAASWVGATKSMTGHLLGAAGAIEALVCTLSVHHNAIPPTINISNLDPAVPAALKITPNTPVFETVDYAMSNTFGFGGHNATVVIKKFAD
ncbi:MAG: 3-oxoacyl-[acyl-carrier-protein] synthase 2 [Cyclobacteriaceae bacterium]|nr:MAG: 3-oxoacyl-[acyl-carrier-protein] synthase 2 [Cyclobacteriaceae bacterium]